MISMYIQKKNIAQKKDASSASSVPDSSSQSESLQRKADMANATAQRAETPRPNNTGMPDNLKAGIESLSGFSMDDVRVHYNSPKPATVQALAYTQGTDIHVAPGQEKHLPHEAWHVAQQMAGRVSPTTNINGMPVNDNAGLEHEADVMGENAVTQRKGLISKNRINRNVSKNMIQCKFGDNGYMHLDVAKNHPVEPIKSRHESEDSALSDPNDLLPIIAFEIIVGINRKNEMVNLYKNEIRRYKGKSHIYVGINISEEDAKKNALDKEVKYLEDNLQPHLNYNHHLILVPFTFTKTTCDEEYTFPYMEARHLLMTLAESSDATIFRWMDSDVREDSSIEAINQNGYAEFDYSEDYKKKLLDDRKQASKDSFDASSPIVYSGFYNWRKNDSESDGKVNGDLHEINRHEANLRYLFWEKKGNLIEQARKEKKTPPPFKAGQGYIPEPIAYMNKLAHQKAMENLWKKINELNAPGCKKKCQQNESRAAFDDIPMVFKSNFSVSKPIKKYFEKVACETVNLDCMKSVRQSAFDQWDPQDLDLSKVLKEPSFCKIEKPKKKEESSENITPTNIETCTKQARIYIYDSFVHACRIIEFDDTIPNVRINHIQDVCRFADQALENIHNKFATNESILFEQTILHITNIIINICLDSIDTAIDSKDTLPLIEYIKAICLIHDQVCTSDNLDGPEKMAILELNIDRIFSSLENLSSQSKSDKSGETRKDADINKFFNYVRQIVQAICNSKDTLPKPEYSVTVLKNAFNAFNSNPNLMVRAGTNKDFITSCLGKENAAEGNITLARGAVEAIIKLHTESNFSPLPQTIKAIIEVCKETWIQPKKQANGSEGYILDMAMFTINKLMLSKKDVNPKSFNEMFSNLKAFFSKQKMTGISDQSIAAFYYINKLLVEDLIEPIGIKGEPSEIPRKISTIQEFNQIAMKKLALCKNDFQIELFKNLYHKTRNVILNAEKELNVGKLNDIWHSIYLALQRKQIDEEKIQEEIDKKLKECL